MRPYKPRLYYDFLSGPRGILNHRDSLIADATPGTEFAVDERKERVGRVIAKMYACGNAQNRRGGGIMRQQKQNKAVHHKKRRPPSNRRREKRKKRTAWRLFHRVTANSLAACQNETPTAKEKRGARDFLFSQDDVTASRNYMLLETSLLCVSVQKYTRQEQHNKRTGCFLPASRNSPPSHCPAGFLLRLKTGWRPPLFFSLLSFRCAIVSYSFQSIQCIVLMRVQPFFFIGIADHFSYCAPRLCVFSNGTLFISHWKICWP